MNTKTVYQCDAAGVYAGETVAHESPLEPGVFLIPAGAVQTAPPTIPAGQRAIWMTDSQSWRLEAVPVDPPPAPPAQTQTDLWAQFQKQAKTKLDASDTTMHRVAEAVALGLTTWTAPDVVTYVEMRRKLRAILSQPKPDSIPDSLPDAPYPANT
ncbi:hypothetical protein [Paludibacterium purpuratum]|uniref:Virus tail fiber assembly protein lambda gpK n=1 Tax=Paludibacterium purpuratum TaxID=1144873 RepID=A0A4R7BEW4_9NEIS|nr:hypothetical protein [Paludibacterium purpuratum]TDR82217.1 hypothetical protein DFP86_102331 [Paludibacterium purpuratum]